jgi:hypothetical protein
MAQNGAGSIGHGAVAETRDLGTPGQPFGQPLGGGRVRAIPPRSNPEVVQWFMDAAKDYGRYERFMG